MACKSQLHKCVESIEEIPKLKFTIKQSVETAIYGIDKSYSRRYKPYCILQEFQYGKDVFQTTTNKRQWFESI